MKKWMIQQNPIQLVEFLLIFLSIFSLNVVMTSAIQSNLFEQNDLTDFEFTGNTSIENYDYDNDGHADILFLNIEINVLNPGLIVLSSICSPTFVLWNSTSNIKGPSYYLCEDSAGSIINLNETGLTNLTLWYGYGTVLPNMTDSSYDYMENANISVNYIFYAYYSNGNINTQKISSPVFKFTLENIHSYSQNIDREGIANAMLQNQIYNLFSGRSSSDSYIWSFHQYYVNLMNLSGVMTSHFETFTPNYVQMVLNRTLDNGTYFDSNNFNYFLERGIYTAGGSLTHFLIPKNINTSKLETFYNLSWSGMLQRNYLYYQNITHLNIEFNTSNTYFRTIISFDFNASFPLSFTYNSYKSEIVYNIPMGLLSNFSIIQYQNATLYQNQIINLIHTSTPNPSNNSTYSSNSQSSSSHTTTQTTNLNIPTADFISNPIFIIIPLVLCTVLIRRNRKN